MISLPLIQSKKEFLKQKIRSSVSADATIDIAFALKTK